MTPTLQTPEVLQLGFLAMQDGQAADFDTRALSEVLRGWRRGLPYEDPYHRAAALGLSLDTKPWGPQAGLRRATATRAVVAQLNLDDVLAVEGPIRAALERHSDRTALAGDFATHGAPSRPRVTVAVLSAPRAATHVEHIADTVRHCLQRAGCKVLVPGHFEPEDSGSGDDAPPTQVHAAAWYTVERADLIVVVGDDTAGELRALAGTWAAAGQSYIMYVSPLESMPPAELSGDPACLSIVPISTPSATAQLVVEAVLRTVPEIVEAASTRRRVAALLEPFAQALAAPNARGPGAVSPRRAPRVPWDGRRVSSTTLAELIPEVTEVAAAALAAALATPPPSADVLCEAEWAAFYDAYEAGGWPVWDVLKVAAGAVASAEGRGPQVRLRARFHDLDSWQGVWRRVHDV